MLVYENIGEHHYIFAKHINGNSGGHETIDQSASMLVDDVIASTNERSFTGANKN